MVLCCDVTENTLTIVSPSRYAGIDLQSRKDLTKRQDDRCISPPFSNPLCLLEFERQTQTSLMSRAKRMRRRFQATMHNFFTLTTVLATMWLPAASFLFWLNDF